MSTTNTAKIQSVQPYLYFEGRGEEAIEFYKKALGAEVEMLMRFKDMPADAAKAGCAPKPELADKIMHASIKIAGSTVLISDGRCDAAPEFKGFSLTISAASAADADLAFAALSPGGQVFMPLDKTFFSPRFGMIKDKFGVLWVIVAQH
jgi:PhnB protein